MVSEFGSALNERSELDCFTSITDYFTSSGLANDGRHAPIQSWFYWCAAPSVLLVHVMYLRVLRLLLSRPFIESCLPKAFASSSGFWTHASLAPIWRPP